MAYNENPSYVPEISITATQHETLVGGASNTIASVGPGSAGQVLTSNGASADPSYQTSPFNTTPNGVFGDGSDGSVTFDGSTVILGITPSGSAYTLARDIFLASSTINNGISIITNGFRIFCNGTLTNNGTIQWNGAAGAVAGTAGAQTANTNSSINNSTAAAGAPGTAGGAGATGTGAHGVNSTTSKSIGGVGGQGGNTGGVGGTLTSPSASGGSPILKYLPTAILGAQYSGSAGSFVSIQAGTGGGGGTGDGVVSGGGGGAGGGFVIVASFLIAGTGSIQARGGAGGAPTSGTGPSGGGGGGGGWVNVISRSVVSAAIAGQTIDANGGSGGVGFGTGSTGGNGNPGTVNILAS